MVVILVIGGSGGEVRDEVCGEERGGFGGVWMEVEEEFRRSPFHGGFGVGL